MSRMPSTALGRPDFSAGGSETASETPRRVSAPFRGWGEIFGDEVTAAAMIDRLVYHAEILSFKGDSCRFNDRDLTRAPAET